MDNYTDSMLMGLRRLLDRNRRSFSLIKLLETIAKNHAILTFDRYLDLLGGPSERDEVFPRMLWSRFSRDGRTLDKRSIQDDIDQLMADHETVLGYIDTVIAHRQAGPTVDLLDGPAAKLGWSDLDRLFDDVAGLFNRYYGLVNPGVHVDFAPVLPAGYQRAFRLMMGGDR